jgi:hypothetical protein
LPGADAIAHIHQALDDLAADAKGQIGLHPRLDIAGQRNRRGEVERLHGLHKYPGMLLGLGFILATAAQQRQQASANIQVEMRAPMQAPLG